MNARATRRRSGGAPTARLAAVEVDVGDVLEELAPGGPRPGSAAADYELPGAGRGMVPTAPPRVAVPTRRQRQAAQRLQARKVARLVRRVDLWSLMKVALLFYLVALVVGVIAGVVVWSLLQRSGTVPSVEDFIKEAFALESFRFDGPLLFRLSVLGGLVGVLVTTLVTVVLGLAFNLICDLTGGLRVSVVEEETTRVVRPRARR